MAIEIKSEREILRQFEIVEHSIETVEQEIDRLQLGIAECEATARGWVAHAVAMAEVLSVSAKNARWQIDE